jgi:hypothetical protein
LQAFIKDCKAIVAISGGQSAAMIFQPAGLKGFPLESFGILRHMPAVQAELCMTAHVAEQLHHMLCSIRSIKQGPDKHKLKASANALPKLEPWSRIIAQVPPILPTLMKDRSTRRELAIETRGERGDGRDLKPSEFLLTCPSCEAQKDCARRILYSTSAAGVTCPQCHKSTTSTRWLCSHKVPWHLCQLHREHGFRCGTKAPGQSKRPDPFKAEARFKAKVKRLGALGAEGIFIPRKRVNSTPPSSDFEHKKIKKEKGHYGECPPPKEDERRGCRALYASQAAQGSSGISLNQQAILCGSSTLPSSYYSQVKASRPGVLDSRPAKRARPAPVKHAQTCKGNCPVSWTIDQYCPHCHG